jgi:predicted dehydrogenase
MMVKTRGAGGEMDQVTVGLIGIGAILDSHLDALKQHPEYRLVSVCRRSESELKRTAEQLGVKGFTDYRDLLADTPDVVLISLPHGMHCRVTEEALQAGCHVLVEKPMAVSVAECRRMLAAAAQAERQLVVTESATFTPGALRTGEKFVLGSLGRFFTGCVVNCRYYFHDGRPDWFLDPAMSGGGMFSNVGLHRLALTRSCLRGLTPARVTGSVHRQPEWRVEACAAAMVGYRDGGSMLYEEVGYYPKPEWLNAGCHLVFQEGIVSWTDTVWRCMTRQGRTIEEPLPPGGGYSGVYGNMLKAIRGEPYWPHAWEYAVDTAIAQAAYASARDKQEVDLTSPEWAIPTEE